MKGSCSNLVSKLPGNYCRLLKSYLSSRRFRVSYEDAQSAFHPIQAGVPQGSVLGPILYLMYTADIPVTENTTTAMFADDTAILSVSSSQVEATQSLQHALDQVTEWTRQWKIKLNEMEVHTRYIRVTTC